MKFKWGTLKNQEGAKKDIIVKAPTEFLVLSAITAAVLAYTIGRSFKLGVRAFEMAEYQTMVDLGIIKE